MAGGFVVLTYTAGMLLRLWKRMTGPTICERLGLEHDREQDDLGRFWCDRCDRRLVP